MLILSIHHGAHDMVAAVADDYQILSAVQAERITRLKGEDRPEYLPQTIREALRIAGAKIADVKLLATSRTKFAARYHRWPPMKAIKYGALRLTGKDSGKMLWPRYCEIGEANHRKVFRAEKFMLDLGLADGVQFFDYNHHFAHALSALFFTNWKSALLYTADGGGDWVNYSARHLQNGELHELYGGDGDIKNPYPVDSIGLAYGFMTQALGYKINRHEGKLTGLAAYGNPTLYDALAHRFSVREDGRILSDFSRYKDMRQKIFELAKKADPADAAASIQKLLEDVILKSVGAYLQKTGARNIGLAGGVFANVALNKKIAELPGVDEVFIFPGMGDEGITVGGLLEFLLRRDGISKWLANRRRLENVYWGGDFDNKFAAAFNAPDIIKLKGDTAEVAAQLLADGKIIALFCGRMEFGPRALGSRSILANPADKSVNDSLNKRLARTEFMPFAPYVLAEDADGVFEITDANRYAMKFMTITCQVREQWRGRIPAVVHIDGTARPQIIQDSDNPLYAAILRRFKERTGLPVLINTSFNAHEEPIIHTPAEALRALQDGRIDFIAAESGVYRAAKKE